MKLLSIIIILKLFQSLSHTKNPHFSPQNISHQDIISYKLPDGYEMSVGTERFESPEVLFHPEIVGKDTCGIQDITRYSIEKSLEQHEVRVAHEPMSVEDQLVQNNENQEFLDSLFANVLVTGGSSKFHGFTGGPGSEN